MRVWLYKLVEKYAKDQTVKIKNSLHEMHTTTVGDSSIRKVSPVL